MGRSEETKARILHAAEEVVLREGVARLTIETAAVEAGISKGGVLYHYPTRDGLVTAMVARLAAAFDADLARYERGADSSPGSFTRAYVQATLNPAGEDERDVRLGAAVIAGVAADPALLSVLRERFADWQRRVEDDDLPDDVATVVRLASDGLWLVELLGLGVPSPAVRARVGDLLLRMAGDARASEVVR